MILHWNSQQSLVLTCIFLAFAFLANSSHVHHSHSSRHSQYEESIHRPQFSSHVERGPLEVDGELLSNSSQKTTILSRGSEVNIVSFVDDFVGSWLRDSRPNSTQAEISDILATANRVKQAFLDPDSVSSLLPPTITSSPSPKRSTNHFHRSTLNSTVTNLAFTNSTLEEARAIVRLAQKEANARNKDRIDNPRVNNYYGKESSKPALKSRAEDAQLLAINATVAAAAAMVAEADAAHSNTTEKDYSIPIDIGRYEKRNLEKRAGSYWLENMNHVGRIPFGGPDNDNYPVFRNVKDYGAVGNGKVDDTAAINRAMTDGNRCGAKCGASSIKGAVVYFPAGQYLISSTIEMYYNTQMIGDATQRSILLAAKSFVGLGLLSSDHYTGNNGGAEEWYINQNNFYRQVRNFIIDLRDADMVDIAGIHWQVAQATSIQDVSFFGSNTAGKSHMGIFAENGSGGFMSDLTFIGGAIGMRCGNQQFTTRKFVFFQCKTAIDMLWDWGWTWKSLYIYGADIGIKMSGDYIGGSILLLDSFMFSTNVGISISTPQGSSGTQEQFSVTLDNLYLEKVTTLIVDKPASLNVAGGSRTIASWVLGKVYDESSSTYGKWSGGGPLSPLHPKTASLTDGTGAYLERSKPQYADIPAATFINAKITLKGDGVYDDTFGLNLLLSVAAGANRPLFIPMGSYVVTDTIKIPLGSRVVGECWSQIVAQGTAFTFMDKPHVMVQVGDEGDVGVVEIQDLLFTSTAPSAGVILMEWNVAQTTPGSAAMWDSHFRIGGAKGSKLQRENCPKLTGSVNGRCVAGSMLLHLTPRSSAYMENIWAWVSDHDIDSSEDQTQIDVYVARGILIESQGPTWLYGTSSEHCVLYQYQLYNARNTFLGMIQTESPYYLPAPQAPAPFTSTVGLFNGDPDFSDCDAVTSPHCSVSWGLRVVGSDNIHIFGAGLYNWFQAYIQPCVDAQDCAQRVAQVLGSSVWLYNLYTIGTVEMINTISGAPVIAKDNTNKKEHPFTSIVNAWLLSTSSSDGSEDDEPYVDDPPCTGIYRNITQVMAAVANIPDHCLDKYLVDAQIATINDSLDKYTETISKGYDSKFKIYAEHIKELVPLQLIAYMAGAQASGFFTCTTTEYQLCCGSTCCPAEDHCICPAVPCNPSKDCQKGLQTKTVNCPTSIPLATDQGLVDEIAYTCTNIDGFKADVAQKYGIDPSWIVFGDYTARINGGCWQSNCDAIHSRVIWSGFPVPAASFSVPDPKDLISGTYDNTRNLAAQLTGKEEWIDDNYEGLMLSDLVDASSVPALMTYSAVTSMDKVVEIAKEITAAQRKEMILNFIMGVLMLIPGVGQLADAAGMAALRSFINLIGDIGNAALTIHGIVEDPSSAVFTLFGALLGGRGSGKSFTDAAGARRGMTSKELESLTPIRGDLTRISNVRTLCLAKK